MKANTADFNYDFSLIFEKMEETNNDLQINSGIETENFKDQNASVLELIEIKREMELQEQDSIFTTT